MYMLSKSKLHTFVQAININNTAADGFKAQYVIDAIKSQIE